MIKIFEDMQLNLLELWLTGSIAFMAVMFNAATAKGRIQ